MDRQVDPRICLWIGSLLAPTEAIFHGLLKGAHGADWPWIVVGSILLSQAMALTTLKIFPLAFGPGHWWHKLGWFLGLLSIMLFLQTIYTALSHSWDVKPRDVGVFPGIVGIVGAQLALQNKRESDSGNSATPA